MYTIEEAMKLVLDGTGTDVQLTFAAEIAGANGEAEIIIPALLKLLGHKAALVREGALLGLDFHAQSKTAKTSLDIRKRISEMAQNDPSPTIRTIVQDLMKSWKD
jgi:hypothetical protein